MKIGGRKRLPEFYSATVLLYAADDEMFEDLRRWNEFFDYREISKADKFTELYYTNLPTH
jgi:hypothetical protein